MSDETFASEAHKCRSLARRYPGSPEGRLLINLAAAFEELARKPDRDSPPSHAADN